MKQYEEFSEICQKAIDKFRKDFPKELIIEPLYGPYTQNINEVAQIIYFRGYLMGLGVSQPEAKKAACFAKQSNFWIKN